MTDSDSSGSLTQSPRGGLKKKPLGSLMMQSSSPQDNQEANTPGLRPKGSLLGSLNTKPKLTVNVKNNFAELAEGNLKRGLQTDINKHEGKQIESDEDFGSPEHDPDKSIGELLDQDSELPVPTTFLKFKSSMLGGRGSKSLQIKEGTEFGRFNKIFSMPHNPSEARRLESPDEDDVFSDNQGLAAKVAQIHSVHSNAAGEDTPTPGLGPRGGRKLLSTQLTFGTGDGSASGTIENEFSKQSVLTLPEPKPATKISSNESPMQPISQASETPSETKKEFLKKIVEASIPIMKQYR